MYKLGYALEVHVSYCRVKGKYQGQVRPKIGAPKLFPAQIEEDIALFVKHCSLLRIPCTRQILKEDILHFVQYKNLNIPKLSEDGPGNRFCFRKPSFSKSCPITVL